jgi:hypothetical protein
LLSGWSSRLLVHEGYCHKKGDREREREGSEIKTDTNKEKWWSSRLLVHEGYCHKKGDREREREGSEIKTDTNKEKLRNMGRKMRDRNKERGTR